MTITHCHFCGNNHSDWDEGVEKWQCRMCSFRIPVAHLWQWCWVKDRPNPPKPIVQLTMWEGL
jgi:DNA-directed RNA polymerase subunit RPC12/RpoP